MCDFDDNVIVFDPVKTYSEDGGEEFSYDEENSEYLQDSDYEYEVETDNTRENSKTEDTLSTNGDETTKQITCDICDQSFETITERNAHIESHFQPIKCPGCGKTFIGDRAFEYHISIGKCKQSVEVKRFRCILCNAKVFDTKDALNTHLDSEHNCIISDKQLICILCDRTFAKFKYLKKHVTEVHEKVSQFTCDVCNKQFNRKANLTEHLLIHEQKYLAKCDTCGKSYRTPSALKLHYRTHTKEKPYKCDLCGEKSYAYNTDLKRHKRSAHGIMGKPFPCNMCTKVFYEPKLLKNHKKRSHRVLE